MVVGMDYKVYVDVTSTAKNELFGVFFEQNICKQ